MSCPLERVETLNLKSCGKMQCALLTPRPLVQSLWQRGPKKKRGSRIRMDLSSKLAQSSCIRKGSCCFLAGHAVKVSQGNVGGPVSFTVSRDRDIVSMHCTAQNCSGFLGDSGLVEGGVREWRRHLYSEITSRLVHNVSGQQGPADGPMELSRAAGKREKRCILI